MIISTLKQIVVGYGVDVYHIKAYFLQPLFLFSKFYKRGPFKSFNILENWLLMLILSILTDSKYVRFTFKDWKGDPSRKLFCYKTWRLTNPLIIRRGLICYSGYVWWIKGLFTRGQNSPILPLSRHSGFSKGLWSRPWQF